MTRKLTENRCPNCNNFVVKYNVYCNVKCQQALKFQELFNAWWNGDVTKLNPNTLRKYMLHKYTHQCSICTHTEWNNEPIPLEVDHIDGDGANDRPDNVRLVCPNCHAQTKTFKGRNRGKGRKNRYK